jgi:sporulation protein YlmC with PRC-barrel domain
MQRDRTYKVALPLLLALLLTLGACRADAPEAGVLATGEPTQESVVVEPLEQDVEAAEAVPIVGAVGEVGVGGIDNGMMLATTLMDRPVTTLAGDEVGTIEDLLVDLATGNILVASVDNGGLLDVDDDRVMMPLRALRWNLEEDAFVLAVVPELFADWPGLGEAWPDAADPTWDDELARFWRNAGADLTWDAAGESQAVAWASRLLDSELSFGGEAAVADVEDLLVDLSQSRAHYLLLAGAFGLGEGDRLHAVPFDAMEVAMREEGGLALRPVVGADAIVQSPPVADRTFGDAVVFDEGSMLELDNYWNQAGFPVRAAAEAVAAASEVITETEAPLGPFGVVGGTSVMMRVSRLLDVDVENTAGEGLGDIEDLHVDAVTGNVLFATIERGGLLGIGGEALPVPLNALVWTPEEEELLLPIRQEVLDSFPAIDEDWSETLDPGWRVVRAFWEEAGYGSPLLAGDVDLRSVLRASEMLGYGVGTYQAPGLGRVEELIVDLERSNVRYVVISFTDTEQFGEEWRLVPFAAFDPTAFGDELAFAEEFNPQILLSVPRIDQDALVERTVLAPGWDEAVAQYWTDAGYGMERE